MGYVIRDQRRDRSTQFFGTGCGGRCPTERQSSNFWLFGETLARQFPLLVGHLDLPVKKILRKGLGPLSVTIFKKVSESIFFQNLQRVKLKMKTRWQIL